MSFGLFGLPMARSFRRRRETIVVRRDPSSASNRIYPVSLKDRSRCDTPSQPESTTNPIAGNDTDLTLSALDVAVRKRNPPAGLIHHSNRGSPYASNEYTGRLRQLGLQPSTSRTGDCWDNAVAESFFASLKGEYLDHDNFYNPQLRHSTLGYVRPHEFELQAQVACWPPSKTGSIPGPNTRSPGTPSFSAWRRAWGGWADAVEGRRPVQCLSGPPRAVLL